MKVILTASGACLKHYHNGYELSIAFRDSTLKNSPTLNHGDLLIFRDDRDMTEVLTGEQSLTATLENINFVIACINRKG